METFLKICVIAFFVVIFWLSYDGKPKFIRTRPRHRDDLEPPLGN